MSFCLHKYTSAIFFTGDIEFREYLLIDCGQMPNTCTNSRKYQSGCSSASRINAALSILAFPWRSVLYRSCFIKLFFPAVVPLRINAKRFIHFFECMPGIFIFNHPKPIRKERLFNQFIYHIPNVGCFVLHNFHAHVLREQRLYCREFFVYCVSHRHSIGTALFGNARIHTVFTIDINR